MATIQFTPQKFTALKAAYNKAVKDKQSSFVFEGNEYLVTYAKYLIEYLGPQIK